MSQTATPTVLTPLTRASGAFAMLAVDQREALRNMLAAHRDGPVSDADVTDFKLRAVEALTPHASAVLLDRQFVLDRAIEEGAVDPGCALIAGADEFIPGPGEVVADVRIDEGVDPEHYRRAGASALKLLVVWRSDEGPQRRVDMVTDFVARVRAAGLAAIIEPVTRAPRDGSAFDREADILSAARELGGLGADLYKAEVPFNGRGDEAAIRRACATMTETVPSPWVVLSSGVDPDDFPRAVALAVAEGASGFLAGRAVWQSCTAAEDLTGCLLGDAADRLERLVDVVDTAIAGR